VWKTKQDDETRKVQFTGGSTYIISLPKRWIAQNQLRKGSFIKFHEEEGGLLTIVPPGVTVEKKIDEATILISSNEDTENTIRKIISAYLTGYNSIYLKTDKHYLTARQRHEMKNFVRRMLVGTEIVTDTSSQLGLQVLLTYPELTVQSALRRMSIITVSMHKDALIALNTNDQGLAKEVMSNDCEVDRFHLYVTRLLKTAMYNPRVIKEIGLTSSNDCLGYRIVSQFIERTADHAVNIAENVLNVKNSLEEEKYKKILQMDTKAIMMFETAMEALFRQDYFSAQKIFEQRIEIMALEKYAIAGIQDHDEGMTFRLIIESIRRIAEYSCDVSEIVLNLTINSIIV
jgi:phosphate uptake regulator